MTFSIKSFARLILILALVDCVLVLFPARWTSSGILSAGDLSRRQVILLSLYNIIIINILIARKCHGTMTPNSGAARELSFALRSINMRSLFTAFLCLLLTLPACALLFYAVSSVLQVILKIMPPEQLYSEKVIVLTAGLILLVIVNRIKRISSGLPRCWLPLATWGCVALIIMTRFEYLDVRGDWLMYYGLTYAILLTGLNIVGLLCRTRGDRKKVQRHSSIHP
jgi:hypothetical protein